MRPKGLTRIHRNLMCLLGLCMGISIPSVADGLFDYRLQPVEIANNTWVVPGSTEDFSRTNGGNIVNTGFIVTEVGVVIIDTGPSVRYARQLEQAVARVTQQPIVAVFNTHHHPDHWFGNQHFQHLPIYALPSTIEGMIAEGNGFADNLYRMSGDWMRATEPAPANQSLTDKTKIWGSHELQFIQLAGHTRADLAILDTSTGVLFTGDLVFDMRAPTTPHAAITDWFDALDSLADVNYTLMVPGHGQPVSDDRALVFTRHYLTWLRDLLTRSALEGDAATEVINKPIPAAFAEASMVREELSRSVIHMYKRLETEQLKQVTAGGYR